METPVIALNRGGGGGCFSQEITLIGLFKKHVAGLFNKCI